MRVQTIDSTLAACDWREALEHLGLEPSDTAMESFYELYAVELRNAMDLAGAKKLREILSRPEIQAAFKLGKAVKARSR